MISENKDSNDKTTCTCNGCSCNNPKESYNKSEQVAAFKEKTDYSKAISDKNLENLSVPDKNLNKKRNYTLTVTDTGTTDGYFIEYSKEITIFEFGLILSEIFDIDVTVDYDALEDLSLDDRTIVFETFDDMLDFLDSRQDDEE